jgi:hypothetical protein
VSGEYVFGFGSLVGLDALAQFLSRSPFEAGEAYSCRLRDHRRLWNIARDNAFDYPGRPHYVDEDGVRLDAFVTAVNIRPAPGQTVNGVVFPVTEENLALLDIREGNYDRITVDGALEPGPVGRIWAYRGKAAAEDRYAQGVASGKAVVNAHYHTIVTDAFASHGEDFLAEYHATTEAPTVPIVPLKTA